MREIKFIGIFRKEGQSRSYSYSLFKCPICGGTIEKIRKDGLKANGCSRSCYAKDRTGKRYGGHSERIIDNGYILVYKPDHPAARGTKKIYVYGHRLIAEQKIGRYLADDEVVHHINGDKQDNRPENLEVMTAGEHSRLHANERSRKRNGSFNKIPGVG